MKQYTCTSLCMNWGRGVVISKILFLPLSFKIYKIQAWEPVKYKYTHIYEYTTNVDIIDYTTTFVG